jgi:DNA-binding beta-propeller fold protein YncE
VVIGGPTDTVVVTVRVGREPLGVATDPQAKAVYITNNGDNTITALTSGRRTSRRPLLVTRGVGN